MDVKIACPCRKVGAHPDGDTVTLRERLDFRSVLAIRNDASLHQLADPDSSVGEWMAFLTEGYILHGIGAWTLVDEKGKPLPVSRADIRELILSDPEIASPVAEAADVAYSKVVMLPLLRGAASSSQPTSTSASTSANGPTEEPTPKPSSPSLTSTTPTDATVTITSSPAGVSS